MIDAVDLRLIEYFKNGLVQLLCRCHVPAKRFFDDDPHPGFSVGVLREAGFVELLDDQGIDVRRRGQVEQPVPGELVSAVQFFQTMFQVFKRFRVMIFAGYVSKGLGKFLTLQIVTRAIICEFLYRIDRQLLERLVRHRRPCKSDDCEPPRNRVIEGGLG